MSDLISNGVDATIRGWMQQREVVARVLPEQAPLVLFICRYNAGLSQIAEAYLRFRLGAYITVKSAGTTPSSLLDRFVFKVLAEDRVPMYDAFPKLIMPADIDAASYIVTIGDGIHGIRRSDEHWNCYGTARQSIEQVTLIRNSLRAQVFLLCRRLSTVVTLPKKVVG